MLNFRNIVIFLIVLFFIPASVSSEEHTVSWSKDAYNLTVKKWSNALNRVSSVESTTYIRKQLHGEDKLHATGHRDVIYWIPATTDLSKPFIMIIWFHGHWGYDENRTFVTRTLKQLVPKAEAGVNFVLVLPEMPWTIHGKTPRKRNSLIWTKKGQFLEFIDEAHSLLSKHNQGKRLGKADYRIVGHSAGGSTIKRLGITGDLCKIDPSMVVWSDSSYGAWLENAWDGCLKDSCTLVSVYVHVGGPPWRSLNRFLNRFRKKDLPANLKFSMMGKGWSHKKIGDNIVDLSNILNKEGHECQQ